MNARQLIVLAVLAAGGVGATAAVLQTRAPTIAADRRGQRVLPALDAKANDISGLVVREGKDTFSVERKDAGFVASDSGYPIKVDDVRDLVASSLELTFEEARTSDPARYPDLGLADPGAANGGKEIILRAGGSDVANFVIGNRDNTVGGPAGGVFVRLEGQPQTWLARGNVHLPSSRSDWFRPLDLEVKRNEIKKIELSGGGRDAVTASASDKPGELKLENVPDKRMPDTFKVSRLAAPAASFSFQDVRKASKPADDPRRMTVQVGDGLRLVFTAVGDPSEGWVQVAAEATSDAQRERADAIRAKVGGYDFRLPSNEAEVLGWTATDLTDEQKS
jgi:Domain of unknown function (DUF4340)